MDFAASKTVKGVTLVLAGLAAALAGLLLYKTLTLEPLIGCGGGSSCETVLNSRWSGWFGVPVSLPALGLYTAMLAAVLFRDLEAKHPQQPAEWVMVFCSIAALAAALWFTVVQVGFVGALCFYCVSTHLLGSAAALLCLLTARPARWVQGATLATVVAVGLVAVLIVGQVMSADPEAAAPEVRYVEAVNDPPEGLVTDGSADAVPVLEPDDAPLPELPKTVFNDPFAADQPLIPTTTPVVPAPVSGAVGAAPGAGSAASDQATAAAASAAGGPPNTGPLAPRKLAFYGGRFKIDTTDIPIIGDPYAEKVLVILYDYTCSHCRETRQTLEKTKQRHGDELAIVCLPTPLDKKCNKSIPRTNPGNRYACDLAQTSLAVWRVAPEKWAGFDKTLYDDETLLTPARSKIKAWAMLDGGEKALKRGLDDPWVAKRISLNSRIYATVARAAGNSNLPMLVTDKGLMSGAPRHPLDIDDLLEGKPVQAGGHEGHNH